MIVYGVNLEVGQKRGGDEEKGGHVVFSDDDVDGYLPHTVIYAQHSLIYGPKMDAKNQN